MDFVLDCSVACGFLFKNQHTPYALQVAECLKQKQAVVPQLFISEIANVLSVQEARGRLEPHKSERMLQLLENLPLVIEDHSSLAQGQVLLHLARKHHLTAYDASYLAVAVKYQIPLATQDKALRQAAEAEKLMFAA